MPFNIAPRALSNDDIDISRNDDGELVIVDKENDERVSIGPDGFSTGSLQTEEASIDSLPTSLDQITGEHDNFAPTMQPRGIYHEGVNRTYIASNRVDADASQLRIECLYYDHDDSEWSDIYHVDNATLDRHYTGVVTVDPEGYIYLVYDARGVPSVAKTTTPHDLSEWEDMGTIPNIRDYRHVATVDGDMCVWGRDGNPEDGPLTLAISSDGADTWSTQTAIDTTNGMYPYGSAVSADGSEFHAYVSARQGYSGETQQFDYVAHVYYDADDGEMHGTDGSVITTPADQAALDSAGSLIETAPDDPSGTVMGSGFVLTSDGPRVAYLHGIDGDSLDWVFSRWNGTAWESTGTIDDQFAFDNQFLGSSMNLSEDSGTIYAHEIMSNRVGGTTSIGRYESADDGSTWSSREAVRDFSELEYGIRKLLPIQRGGPLRWLATELIDPNEAEPNEPANMYGMADDFSDIVAAQPPKRTQQRSSQAGSAAGGGGVSPYDAFCYVSLSSDTTITGGGRSPVPFDNVHEDQVDAWDETNQVFVVPRSGRYEINFTVRFENVIQGERYNMSVVRDDLERGLVNTYSAGSDMSFETRQLQQTRYYSAGEELSFELFLDSDTTIAGNPLTSVRTGVQIAPDLADARFWD